MKRFGQMSESIELGIVLAFAGGFMDAYSYICRGQVFANAQTGNMLLLGISISKQDWATAVRYLFPVLAFAVGIAIADGVRLYKKEKKLHWRQLTVLCEVLVLTVIAFIPQEYNLLANSITSFACGLQVESFRKIHGNAVATTMCIGNLRSATSSISEYCHTKNRQALLRGILYYAIIVCFIIGAVVGNLFVGRLLEKAILVCAAILLLAFVMMFADREIKEK